jgi:hypothetical protein
MTIAIKDGSAPHGDYQNCSNLLVPFFTINNAICRGLGTVFLRNPFDGKCSRTSFSPIMTHAYIVTKTIKVTGYCYRHRGRARFVRPASA